MQPDSLIVMFIISIINMPVSRHADLGHTLLFCGFYFYEKMLLTASLIVSIQLIHPSVLNLKYRHRYVFNHFYYWPLHGSIENSCGYYNCFVFIDVKYTLNNIITSSLLKKEVQGIKVYLFHSSKLYTLMNKTVCVREKNIIF